MPAANNRSAKTTGTTAPSSPVTAAGSASANEYDYDWADMAFGSKKPLRDLKAVFVAAPRELSVARFKQLVKQYLPQGNIVLGLAKEPFVDGFDQQPQFTTLQARTVQGVSTQVNDANPAHRIYTLHYFQRELPHLLDKLHFKRVVLVNGSWQHVFHVSPAYYTLAGQGIAYDMVSPFASEDEARAYEKHTETAIITRLDKLDVLNKHRYNETEMLHIANLSASRSYDYSFQTGAALGQPIAGKPGTYKLLSSTFNKVVPYQTYAMHHGASREKNFSPPNDLNHYDAVHAEVMLIAGALQARADISGTTLFINLMPCPSCARMLTQTDIREFVYSIDHSDGYALQMLEAAGKKVRRLVL
jgi:deoxycytidylate deaminase